MSEKHHTVDADLAGRVMALEQRVKGLQGRTAAIETRISGGTGSTVADIDVTGEDFVPAMSCTGSRPVGPSAVTDTSGPSMAQKLPDDRVSLSLHVLQAVDVTGLIAGAILVAAGLLLYSGSVEIIRNPLVVAGCGIVLIAGALKRMVL